MATILEITLSHEAEERLVTKIAERVTALNLKEEQKALCIIPQPKHILTRQETAKLLNISLPTLNQYTKEGYITAYRLVFKVRYRIEDINLALKKIKTKSI